MRTQTKPSHQKKHFTRLALIGLLIIGLSLACMLSGVETSPEESLEDKVATSVAKTMAAQAPEAPPLASDTPAAPAPLPTATLSPTSEPDIMYEGISFSYNDALAASIAPVTIPAEVSGMGPFANIPEHIQFNFAGYPLVNTFHDPHIMVFSTDAYRAVNPTAGETIDSLQELLVSQPSNPESIPLLPIWNAAQFMQAQVSYFDFQNGSGVRFLTMYGQAANVVNNNDLFYSYQGLTNDGRYYISAVLPISHPSLPDTSPGIFDADFYDNFAVYIIEAENQLNGQAGDSFFPTLSLLDEMIQSFTIVSP